MSEPAPSYLTVTRTLRSWLFTHDHKRIGVMYLVSTSLALALGGLFAMLVRIEHLTPGPTIMSAGTYNRMFTLHGVVMVWMFMIPAIPSGFGNFLLPLMIGARDVAFPRLNLASLWVYWLGSTVLLTSLVLGGVDTGWTFYPPYASITTSAVVPAAAGVFILGMSSILTGINFITTTHTLRARGVGWMRMPLFVWALYGTAIIQVVATPVLGMVLILTGIDHALNWGIFDPARGGDPLLFQHLFWFYSHPAVYIMILPAMGVVSEVVSTFAHKAPTSYSLIAYSSLGIAFVGFLTWGHHMFTAGLSLFDAAVFGLLSMLVAIFSAIKVYTSIVLSTPLLYVFAFLFLFVFGGMTGVAVATQSLDVHWHDTYFVVAHFHFIMVGATMTAFLAGLHYWWPKITGRLYSERCGAIASVLVFWGFFFTFFPQFLLGNAGMPRRYYLYAPRFQVLHVVSTVGSWVLAGALLYTLGYLTIALFRGPKAGRDPWGSASFEWRTPSPPPEENFDRTPDFEDGPYDYPRGDPS